MIKLNYIKQSACICIAMTIMTISLYAGPVKRQITLKQPDGTTIEAIVQGDEFFAYMQSMDGYTIMQNDAGWWTYAERGSDGNLIAGSIQYNRNMLKSGKEKNLLPSKSVLDKINTRRQQFNNRLIEKFKKVESTLKSTRAGSAYTGTWEVPVILLDFKDVKGTTTLADFDKFFHDMDDQNAGSFNQYYYQNSGGTFKINATVFNWTTDKNDASYYANTNANSQSRVKDAVRRAIDNIENTINPDWTKFDNQKSGKVDMVIVVHAGEGAAWRGNNDYIWAHMWWGLNKRHDGVDFDVYNVQPEKQDGNKSSIGLYVHEFGHALGLPDLYDYTGKSSGIGKWGVMAGGSWNGSGYCPAHFCAWAKYKLGWVNPIELKGKSEVVTVKKYHNYNGPATNNVYRYSTSNEKEYFLISNRRKDAYDWALPGQGLIVEHVNEDGNNTTNRDNPKVKIIEADGQWDLYSGGSSSDSDPFPGSMNVTMLNDGTTPNTNLFDGNASGLMLSNIEQVEDAFDITFKVGFSEDDAPLIVRVEGKGAVGKGINVEAEFLGDVTSYEWKFPGATNSASTVKNPIVTYNQPGQYSVELTVSNKNGTTTKTFDMCIHVEPATDICEAQGMKGTGGDYINWVKIGDFSHENDWSLYSSYKSTIIEMPVKKSFAVEFDIENLYDTDMPFGWIDWNRDNVFDDEEQIIFPGYKEYGTTTKFIGTQATVTPPADAIGYYILRIRNQYGNATPTSCGDQVYGEVEDYTINLVSTETDNLGHCQGTSKEGLGGDYVSNVIINGLSYPSGKSMYSDFKYKDIAIRDESFRILINLSRSFNDIICAWIDWNNDGDFQESEKIDIKRISKLKGSANIKVPNGLSGKRVLRVRNQWINTNDNNSGEIPSPCGNDIYGEVEDYLLDIQYVSTDISNTPEQELGFKTYPNPVDNILNISLNLKQRKDVTIAVVDLTGRTVYSINKNIEAGGVATAIDMVRLPKGMYLIKVNTDEESFVKTILKK